MITRATGMSYKTVCKGMIELDNDKLDSARIRKPGGGRKYLLEKDESLLDDFRNLIEPTTRGDPESPLLWTSKSTNNLAKALHKSGHTISERSVYNLLKREGYSLQSNRKKLEGSSSPDRNAQFEFIYKKIKKFQHEGQPVISVDAKQKENIGNFKNNGREYSKKGSPTEVNTYDFIDKEKGKITPYGIYDLTENTGWVNVGISKDTAKFAVSSIRSWWHGMGKTQYMNANRLLITADCGGSNSYRTRLWKVELQKLSNELGIEIHVSHFPPGTSKWNKIEHRMFSCISKNWRGKPLIDIATVVNLIGNTKTKSGLEIKVKLDTQIYEKGIKVSDEELEAVNITTEAFHGEWNYLIASINQ
jgi:transposase